MKSLTRYFWFLIYHVVAKRLPHSYAKVGGKTGKTLRSLCGRHLLRFCGRDVNIEKGASFGSGQRISLGDHSDLGIDCQIYGDLSIGRYSFMGPDVVVWSTNHRFDRTDIPMALQGIGPERPVRIGDDVWIGTRAILLAGVHIGNHAVVGAGAVVAKDVPEWAIVVGNPARVIRYRNVQEQQRKFAAQPGKFHDAERSPVSVS